MSKTLQQIHDDSPLNYPQVWAIVKGVCPDTAPGSPTAVQMAIRRGTDRAGLLRAFALAYKLPFAEILEAAQESRRLERERNSLAKQIVIESLQ